MTLVFFIIDMAMHAKVFHTHDIGEQWEGKLFCNKMLCNSYMCDKRRRKDMVKKVTYVSLTNSLLFLCSTIFFFLFYILGIVFRHPPGRLQITTLSCAGRS